MYGYGDCADELSELSLVGGEVEDKNSGRVFEPRSTRFRFILRQDAGHPEPRGAGRLGRKPEDTRSVIRERRRYFARPLNSGATSR
jgi:hypothetical protein